MLLSLLSLGVAAAALPTPFLQDSAPATAATPAVASADWPHFLGPNRDGTAPRIESDFAWGEDGPEELWRLEIGRGYGGAAIRDGRVFLFDRDGTHGDMLRVLDIESGEELWGDGYPAEGRLQFQGSRSVPAVDEERVYTTGGFGQIAAFDRGEQRLAWMHDMEEVFGGLAPMFGWSSSPVLVDELVIGTALGEDVGLVAFDRATGDEVWVTEGLGYSHSTPTVMELLGERFLVFLSTETSASGTDRAAPTRVTGLDLEDGSIAWQFVTTLTRLPIPPPVRIDDARFFLTGGYRSGSTMIGVSKEDGKYAFEELWHIDRGAQVHTPLQLDDHLYVIVNENWNHMRRNKAEGGLLCLGLDGEEVWRTGEEPFFGRGSAILAGEHLVVQDGDTGFLHVIQASPEAYIEVARADLFGVSDRRSNEMWAPLALSGRLLLLRSQEELVCVRL